MIRYVLLVVATSLAAFMSEDRGIVQFFLQSFKKEYYTPSYDMRVSVTCSQRALEEKYCAARIQFIQNHYQKHLNTHTRLPRLALCLSGGGLRAMIGSLGFLQALEDTQVLDAIIYISSLSGSSWAVSGWLESALSVQQYAHFLKNKVAQGLLQSIDMASLLQELCKKLSYEQELSVADLWGACLAQKILANTKAKKLSQIDVANYSLLPLDGSQPIPLYSNVLVHPQSESHYEWVEWTPWCMNCPYLSTEIPVWAAGREFQDGTSAAYTPPFSLSYCLGTWGSAMAFDGQDLLEHASQDGGLFHRYLLSTLLFFVRHRPLLNAATSLRIFPAVIPNWNYHFDKKPWYPERELTLVDAGLRCNLPLPPLLERNVDYIIVCDLSWEPNSGAQLLQAKEYALEYQLPFPLIKEDELAKPYSFHVDPKGQAPTLLYLPMIPHEHYLNGWDPFSAKFTSTFNLTYTQEQFDCMFNYGYYLGKLSAEIILQQLSIS